MPIVFAALQRYQRFYLLIKVCPGGWVMLHNSCYRLDRVSVSQSAAQTFCRGKNGRLALVSSLDEMTVLRTHMYSQGIYTDRAWIDGSDEASEGVWRTGTGEVMPYTGFKPPEEPNGGRAENCIGLVSHGAFDITCDYNVWTPYAYCEY